MSIPHTILTEEVRDLTGETIDKTGEVTDLIGEVTDLIGETRDQTGVLKNRREVKPQMVDIRVKENHRKDLLVSLLTSDKKTS